MMKKIIYIAILLLASNVLHSQVTQEWIKFYYNETNNAMGKVIATDTLGNVYVAGDGGNFYTAVVKYNSAGSQIWANRYMLDNSYPGYMAIDKNGDVYIAGTGSYYILTKISKDGNIIWKRTYSGTQYQPENYLSGLVITESNCPVITGALGYNGTKLDIVTIKYGTNGDTLWSVRYNSLNDNSDQAASLAIARDGSLLVTGYRYNYSTGLNHSFLTLKYDSSGVLKWARIYGSPDSLNTLTDGTFDNNGNIYVTGQLNLIAYCTIKYNANGDFKWARIYSNSSSSSPYAIKTDNLGNVIVTGLNTPAFERFVTTVKYDSLGNQLWIKQLSEIGDTSTVLSGKNSISLDNSNNIYFTGSYVIRNHPSAQLGIFTAKLNSNGTLPWFKTFSGNKLYDYGGSAIVINKYNEVFIVGTTQDSINGFGFVTIKYSQPTAITQISNEIPNNYKLLQNYPNPFNNSAKIKYQIPKNSLVQLKVFDILGREVNTLVNEIQSAGIYETSFNGQNLASGIYIYELKVINQDGQSINFRDVKRMVLLK